MRSRIIAVLGFSAVLSVAACGGGGGEVPTRAMGATEPTTVTAETVVPSETGERYGAGAYASEDYATEDYDKQEPVTDAVVPAKFEVGLQANRVQDCPQGLPCTGYRGVDVLVTNIGEVALASGVITIELPGAYRGETAEGSCNGGNGTFDCGFEAFEPRGEIVVKIFSHDPSDGSTTPTEATVTVAGDLPDGALMRTPPMQVPLLEG